MTRVIMLGLICLCLSSCYTPKILKFSTYKQVQKELETSIYYDHLTNTKFYKYIVYPFSNNPQYFKSLNKNQSYFVEKNILPDSIKLYKNDFEVVYDGLIMSQEKLPEILIILKLKFDSIKVINYIKRNFNQSLQFNKNVYYKIDSNNKVLQFFNIINKKNNTYISYYYYKYNNLFNYIYMNYAICGIHTHKDDGFVLDTFDWSKKNKGINYIVNINRTDSHEFYIKKQLLTKYGLNYFLNFQLINDNSAQYLFEGLSETKFTPINYFKYLDSFFKMENPILGIQNVNKILPKDIDSPWNYSEKWNYIQALATYYTFLGEYKLPLELESEEYNTHFNFKKINNIPIKISSIYPHFLDLLKNKKIVAFNEAHHDVRARVFLISILDSLKQLGFTHIAFEGLSKLNRNKNTNKTEGFYTNEPIFNNLISLAKIKGFKLIFYDVNSSGYLREKKGAKNILRKINLDKNKLIIFCGYDHIQKRYKTNNFKLFKIVDYIHKYSNIEPFCIDLSSTRKYYYDSNIFNYYTIKNDKDSLLNMHSFKNGNYKTNISIYQPSSIDYFDYAFYDSHKIIQFYKKNIQLIELNNLPDTLIIESYYLANSTIINVKKIVPNFVKIIHKKELTNFQLYAFIKGEYLVQIKDIFNNILFKNKYIFE